MTFTIRGITILYYTIYIYILNNIINTSKCFIFRSIKRKNFIGSCTSTMSNKSAISDSSSSSSDISSSSDSNNTAATCTSSTVTVLFPHTTTCHILNLSCVICDNILVNNADEFEYKNPHLL